MRISKSFSARLSATILLVTSILFITAIMVVSYYSHKLIAEEAIKSASNVLYTTTIDINKTLDRVESTVNNMQWIVEEHLEDTTYLYHITTEIVASNEEIVGSTIAFIPEFFKGKHYFSPYSCNDENDSIIVKQLGNDKYNYFEMEWFDVPFKTKEPHWSNPYFDEGGGQVMMTTYSLPLTDKQGNIFAILTADISLEWLTQKISSLHPYENSFTFLLCKDGYYITGDQPNKAMKYDAETQNKTHNEYEQLGKRMIAGDSGTLQIGDYNAFAVYGPLYNGWSTAIISPYKDVFARLMRMNLIIIVVSSIGLFLLFFACFRTIRKLTQPITEFTVAALNMAKGNFQARLPKIHSQDEMLQLYNSFDYMQKSLTHYVQELRSTTKENERMESELNIARQIQLSMVPTNFPNNEKYDIHATLQPAREVGGDFYHFLVVDDVIFFVIGDVSGKGVPAALVMSITRAAFRFLGGLGLSIDKMIEKINGTLCTRNETNMFVTLFAGKIDLKTGLLSYCNAGHNPLIICHADGNAEYLHAKPNIAVGVFDGVPFNPEQIQLEKGSRLILYTDGVTEAEDRDKKQYGEQQLLDFAQNIEKNESAEELISSLMTDVKSFTKDAEQNDDITVLTITLKQE